MEKRRLKPEEWALVRRRWEGAPEEGFDWLAREVAQALGVDISRQAVAKMAGKKGWSKGSEPSQPMAKVARPGSVKVAQPQAAKVAQPAPRQKPGKAPANSSEVAPAKLPPAGRIKYEDTGLTGPREEFAVLLAKGLNQSEAYKQAFPRSVDWKPGAVSTEACLLAGKPEVAQRVQDLMAQAAADNGADVALVLRQYLTRLQADPRELTEIRRTPCRHCWGKGHRHQFTDGELEDARETHESKRQARIEAELGDIGEFNEKGGGGYSAAAAPNPDCPTCAGGGGNRVVLKDSRDYSQAALALFGGVKQTKEGIEVKIADRMDALTQVARHVGFFEADKDPGVSISVTVTELDAIYAEAMDKAQAAKQFVMKRMERIGAKLPGPSVDSEDAHDAG